MVFGGKCFRAPSNADGIVRLTGIGASIACTEDKRIVRPHDMRNSLGIGMIQQSYFKLLHHMINGFGFLFCGSWLS